MGSGELSMYCIAKLVNFLLVLKRYNQSRGRPLSPSGVKVVVCDSIDFVSFNSPSK